MSNAQKPDPKNPDAGFLDSTAQPIPQSPDVLLSPSQYCQLTKRGELEVIEVRGAGFYAAIALQGAQLLEFWAADQPWIWLSEKASYQSGESVRGGIPICWPWFGAASKNPAQVQSLISSDNPEAHGLVREKLWTLSNLEESSDSVGLSFELEVSPSAEWSGAAKLNLEISLSASALELKLTTLARTQIHFSQALHSYFATSDIATSFVSGLQNISFYDALDNWAERCQSTALVFDQETDRVYDSAPPSINLHTPEHTLSLCSNSRSLVAWNPWTEKSKRLSQFDDKAYLHMLCLETANLLSDAVSLDGGESHRLNLRVSKLK